ncbi:MAG: YfcE family phosphodiesterase [Treponema sp.]|nr:YfcE family phosphodiesterase [Treponema sp.]
MIELTQQENLAIGNKEYIDSLNEKEFGRALLLSDSHGNPRVMQSIITHFGPLCDILCFCGDGLLDLVETLERGFFDPEFGKAIPPALFFVRGNGDNSTITIFTDQRIPVSVPETQEFSLAGRKFMITHGHRFNVYYGTRDLKAEAISRGVDVVLYGHTHVPNSLRTHVLRDGYNQLLGVTNPGSCALARGGMPNTFAIIDAHKDEDKTVCHYYRIIEDRFGDYNFEEMPTPRGEIKLF